MELRLKPFKTLLDVREQYKATGAPYEKYIDQFDMDEEQYELFLSLLTDFQREKIKSGFNFWEEIYLNVI